MLSLASIGRPWRSICTLLRLFHNSRVTTYPEPSMLTAGVSAGGDPRHWCRMRRVTLAHRPICVGRSLSTPKPLSQRTDLFVWLEGLKGLTMRWSGRV